MGGGLSLGAKVAIGVAIPAGLVLALLAACIIVSQRRRRRQRQLKHTSHESKVKAPRESHKSSSAEKPEQNRSTAVREFQPTETPSHATDVEALQGSTATYGVSSTNRPLELSAPDPAYELSNSSLSPQFKEEKRTSRSQFTPVPETTEANRGTPSLHGSDTFKDRYKRTVEGPQLSYRSETAPKRIGPLLPSPREAHLVSQRTIEQLRAEHARLEVEMSKQGRLEKLRSERDLLQRRIEEMEEEPYVRS